MTVKTSLCSLKGDTQDLYISSSLFSSAELPQSCITDENSLKWSKPRQHFRSTYLCVRPSSGSPQREERSSVVLLVWAVLLKWIHARASRGDQCYCTIITYITKHEPLSTLFVFWPIRSHRQCASPRVSSMSIIMNSSWGENNSTQWERQRLGLDCKWKVHCCLCYSRNPPVRRGPVVLMTSYQGFAWTEPQMFSTDVEKQHICCCRVLQHPLRCQCHLSHVAQSQYVLATGG